MDKREIRKNVTQALASLPVSSLLDVDQISSALLQSTVSNHLVCFVVISAQKYVTTHFKQWVQN